MPWYAQLVDLPDTHKLWADTGSALEDVYLRLGYVEVPAPGAEPVEPLTEVEHAAAVSAGMVIAGPHDAGWARPELIRLATSLAEDGQYDHVSPAVRALIDSLGLEPEPLLGGRD